MVHSSNNYIIVMHIILSVDRKGWRLTFKAYTSHFLLVHVLAMGLQKLMDAQVDFIMLFADMGYEIFIMMIIPFPIPCRSCTKLVTMTDTDNTFYCRVNFNVKTLGADFNQSCSWSSVHENCMCNINFQIIIPSMLRQFFHTANSLSPW